MSERLREQPELGRRYILSFVDTFLRKMLPREGQHCGYSLPGAVYGAGTMASKEGRNAFEFS